MPVSPARLVFLAALLALPAVPQAAQGQETVLTFDRFTQTAKHLPAGGGGARMDTSRAEILVVVGERRLIVREPAREWVYDFDRRRVRIVDAESMTYADWSLFSLVAFNDLELTNRIQKGGPGTPAVREIEALFSMSAAGVKPRRESLVDSSRGDQVEVRIGGRPFTSADLSEHVVPAAQAETFERFLLYHCHLHPIARRAIVRSNRVPQTLIFRTIDGDEESIVSMRLIKATTTPEISDPTRGLARADITDRKFAALSARLKACEEQSADTSRARRSSQSIDFEATATREGRFLDASLARLSRMMESCESLSLAAWPAELRKKVESDTSFRAILQAADSLDARRARQVVERLSRLEGSNLALGYVVDLQMGRARLATGDVENGARQVLHGLKPSPCAIGAWMDLGTAYYRTQQPVLAWLCFDAARAAAPKGCAELAAFERIETDLLKRRPEFLK